MIADIALGRRTQLAVEGMTCASCASRIERALGRIDGVRAEVNFATEVALVEHPETVSAPELVHVVQSAGYQARPLQAGADQAPSDATASARRRLRVTGALALPVVVLSLISMYPLAMSPDAPRWAAWLSFAAATPVVFWGALPFHSAALRNLRHRGATMDTLVSLGVLAAYGWSVFALLRGSFLPPHAGSGGIGLTPAGGSGHLYFEVAAAVTFAVLLGREFEQRSKRESADAIRSLAQLGVKTVAVLPSGGSHSGEPTATPIAELAVDDRFLVRPGERVAADGVVEEGASAVDLSVLTGESVPVELGPGDEVVGGSLNISGRLVVRAQKVGEDTRLAQTARLVALAQNGKTQVQRLADRVSAVFVPVVIVLAALTLAGWLIVGAAPSTAVGAAVAVLIIACPCALGLATPTALLVGTGRGAQLGILIKGPHVLEQTRQIDTVVFDKTGTLTTGQLTVAAVLPAPGVAGPEALRLAGALLEASEHPAARAVAARARVLFADLPVVREFRQAAGLGVVGVVDGHEVLAGNAAWLAQQGISVPAQTEGVSVLVAWDGALRAAVVLRDEVRPSSAAAVAELRGMGLRTILLTGDNAGAANAVAEVVGVDQVLADQRPEGKARVVRELQAQGRVVAMVGDGVNDAAALAGADLSLAMGSGTDVAIGAADITVTRSDLTAVPTAIRLARATLKTIKTNLFWAFAYNAAALPLAALGLASPLFAGLAMSFSSVFVVGNSLRLRSFR